MAKKTAFTQCVLNPSYLALLFTYLGAPPLLLVCQCFCFCSCMRCCAAAAGAPAAPAAAAATSRHRCTIRPV
jgi:hypothetical protein